jgi:hypothetical protein
MATPKKTPAKRPAPEADTDALAQAEEACWQAYGDALGLPKDSVVRQQLVYKRPSPSGQSRRPSCKACCVL